MQQSNLENYDHINGTTSLGKDLVVTTVDQSINLSLPSSSQRARHGPSHEIYLLTEVQHKRMRM